MRPCYKYYRLQKDFQKILMHITLGARDFSSAVSGFYQVFIVTRKFPPHARKTSGTQGTCTFFRFLRWFPNIQGSLLN